MSDSKTPVLLIVEDDEELLMALKTKFEGENFSVFIGRNGEEGLSLALKNHPNVILLDVLMPKVNGMQMLAKLREDSWGNSVPVIMLTSVSPESNSELSKLNTTQPAYYLIKTNTNPDEVSQKVHELLHKEQQI